MSMNCPVFWTIRMSADFNLKFRPATTRRQMLFATLMVGVKNFGNVASGDAPAIISLCYSFSLRVVLSIFCQTVKQTHKSRYMTQK